MHLDMKKVPDSDKVEITVYAEPIKILDIRDGYVFCEWEGHRWKASLPAVLAEAILSDDINDEMRGRLVVTLNELLREQGKEEI